jgi:hypothetical protein
MSQPAPAEPQRFASFWDFYPSMKAARRGDLIKGRLA